MSNNRRLSDPRPFSALDALLSAGTIDDRQHAAGLAYGRLRRRYEDGIVWARLRRSPMSDEAWVAMKRDHAALIRAAGAERFVLDRLCLDDDAPLRCEVERVRKALGRIAAGQGCPRPSDARGTPLQRVPMSDSL